MAFVGPRSRRGVPDGTRTRRSRRRAEPAGRARSPGSTGSLAAARARARVGAGIGSSTRAQREADGQGGQQDSRQQRGAHNPSLVAATMWRSHTIPSSCIATPVRRNARPTQLPVSQANGSAPIH